MNLARKLACSLTIGMLVLAVSVVNGETKEKASPKNDHRSIHRKAVHKACCVRFGGSAFAEPCDRVGEMPATAEPMHIIGKLPSTRNLR
jgi:hypothetical protein